MLPNTACPPYRSVKTTYLGDGGYDVTGKQTRMPLQGTARRANEASPEGRKGHPYWCQI